MRFTLTIDYDAEDSDEANETVERLMVHMVEMGMTDMLVSLEPYQDEPAEEPTSC